MDTRNRPKVSVCIVTYNHEKYIRGCLQSLVDQARNFLFEIVIADDCSTDNTRCIVQEYARKYPDIIRTFFHEKNIGPAKNYVFVHEQAVGEYIAHVDGDDYALPGKLQMQVDYLDSNPECNIVWHRMRLLNVAKDLLVDDLIDISSLPKTRFDRGDILRFITIGMNSSKMYRANVRDFPLPIFPVVDYFINVEQVGSGYAAFVGTEPLGVYRVGGGVASAGNLTRIVLRDSFLYFLSKYPKHAKDIGVAAFVLFVAALKNKQWSNVRLFGSVVLKTFRLETMSLILSSRKMVSMLKLPVDVRR
ncbi:glycosyltransferase [Massilia oculi]|uniref:Glycosyltransferase n=1 Tax=Massilia hydrophila TaxID=3044279 RepID=A0ABS7Y4N9_9BURK|nr:glycosyltransferase [Massilia oculi]MCA1854621.1 glycosyltransferase [Massilia oculi]